MAAGMSIRWGQWAAQAPHLMHCFACSACAVACPMGAVVYDSGVDAYLTCDQCGGDPLCVKICPTGALSFAEPAQSSVERRSSYAEKRHDPKEVL